MVFIKCTTPVCQYFCYLLVHGITDLGGKERSEVSRNMTEEKVKFTSDYKTRHLLQHT